MTPTKLAISLRWWIIDFIKKKYNLLLFICLTIDNAFALSTVNNGMNIIFLCLINYFEKVTQVWKEILLILIKLQRKFFITFSSTTGYESGIWTNLNKYFSYPKEKSCFHRFWKCFSTFLKYGNKTLPLIKNKRDKNKG